MKKTMFAMSVLLVAPLVFLAAAYSSNVPMWDQWSYFDLMTGGPFTMFFAQYGHHRMGSGGVIAWAVGQLTHLNYQAIAYATVALLFGTALLALKLQERLSGSLKASDVVIPVCLLTASQVGTFLVNSSIIQVAAPAA